MEKTSPLQKAVKITGSQSALARSLGLKQAHIWNWLNKGGRRVPAEYCQAIEEATGGQVTRHDLRPDIFRPSDKAA